MNLVEAVDSYILANSDRHIMLVSPTCRKMEYYLWRLFERGNVDVNNRSVVSPKKNETLGAFYTADLKWSIDPEVKEIRKEANRYDLKDQIVFAKTPTYSEGRREVYTGTTNLLVPLQGILFAATPEGIIKRPLLRQKALGRRYDTLVNKLDLTNLPKWKSPFPYNGIPY